MPGLTIISSTPSITSTAGMPSFHSTFSYPLRQSSASPSSPSGFESLIRTWKPFFASSSAAATPLRAMPTTRYLFIMPPYPPHANMVSVSRHKIVVTIMYIATMRVSGMPPSSKW